MKIETDTPLNELPDRGVIFPEPQLPDSQSIIDNGRALARTWNVGPSVFHKAHGVSCESEYKKKCIGNGRIMQHAHMGFRELARSRQAFMEIHDAVERAGATVDRFGICLDWSMGFPRAKRNEQMRGTGLVMDGPEDFASVSNAAPAASHYGDFVLGFPAALENTQCALSAGSTVIGNLGQYFTFRLPNWTDDIETTTNTLTAISLMAAQPVDVLVHSNLDDGFAGVFRDLSCALGAAMVEQYLVEELLGGKVTHCFGHHYSSPELRLGFHRALSVISNHPGSMVYGNTTSYRGTEAENYASLAAYLQVDICAQRLAPSGHAINPVPVTENYRIPDIQEIIDAQLFANRLGQVTMTMASPVDPVIIEDLAATLIQGATVFKDNLLNGFGNVGIDIRDPFEMFLAIRRVGGRLLESLYGPGEKDEGSPIRKAIVESDTTRELREEVRHQVQMIRECGPNDFSPNGLKVLVATTDVHEHGKMLLEGVFGELGIEIMDGGVSSNPHELAVLVGENRVDAIALSTYNGVALTYFNQLSEELEEYGISIPVLIGGQLNQIPEESGDSLPRDVTSELQQRGAVICRQISDAMPILAELAQTRQQVN